MGVPLTNIRLVKGPFSTCCWKYTNFYFITYKGYVYLPHYFMWLKHNGLIPSFKKLQQLCYTKQCVNPQHYHLVDGSEQYKLSYREANLIDEKINKAVIDMILREGFTFEW